jgi:site-specific recombinase XerD
MKGIKQPKLTAKQRTAILKDAKRELASYKYAYAQLNRHGILVVYFRRKGQKPIRIRDPLGSIAFKVTHDALMAGQPTPTVTVTPKITERLARTVSKPRTLGWLIEQYTTSDHWKGLSASYQRSRSLILDHIRKTSPKGFPNYHFGDCPLAEFDEVKVKEIRDYKVVKVLVLDERTGKVLRTKSTNLGAADSWFLALKAMFTWAVNESDLNISRNPTLGIKKLNTKSRGFHTWTLAEVEQFRNEWGEGTRERLAFEIMLMTLSRRHDASEFGPQWLKKDRKGRPYFHFTQRKNMGTEHETEARIPYFPELQALVAKTKNVGLQAFIVSLKGTPYTNESFGNWFRKAVRKAKLPLGCSPHGLRKAGMVELIRLGYSRRQIMALSGHTTEKEFDRYARAYLRDEAMEQLYDDWLDRHAERSQRDEELADVG